MTVKEFLALPKKLRDPTKRLRDEIERLKREITVEYTGFKEETEKRCCGKLTFATEQEALASIIPSRSKKSQKPMRAYQCNQGYWHLSGQPKKKMSAEIKYFKNNS
jgi:uncharacterized protein with PIN domain